MTITQIKYFIAVARHKNISKAAESLFVSQPALSLQIKRLEQELRLSLFHREPQGVRLTAAGEAFLKDALLVEKSWNRLLEGAGQYSAAACSQVNISLGPRAFSNGIFELVTEFFNDYKETQVTFVTDIDAHFLDALYEKRIDMAIDRLPPESMIRHREEFYISGLIDERQCVLTAPEDALADLGEIPFSALDKCTFISAPVGSSDDVELKELCLTHGINPGLIHRSGDISSVMSLVAGGKGISLGPVSFAGKYNVAAVPLTPEMNISLDLICLKENSRNPVVVNLEKFLKAHIRENRE